MGEGGGGEGGGDGGGGGGAGGGTGNKVITVKFGDEIRKIGIEASDSCIMEAIRASFGLRTRRTFWLEDEFGIVRPLSKDMPTSSLLSLMLDPGIPVKLCAYDEAGRLTGEAYSKVFFSDADLKDFLSRRGWVSLREMGSLRDIDNIEELNSIAVYQRGSIVLDGGNC